MSIDESRADLLKCPISLELFRDPVIGSDGHTYERKNITEWIRKHKNSPITRQPMTLNSLRPNYTIKRIVDDFHSSSDEKRYHFRLNVDICKSNSQPLIQSSTKTIYKGRWLKENGPSIVLFEIHGVCAKHEASFYVQLSCHPHIVRTYGLIDCDSSDSITLVQEYAPEGDLSELFRKRHFQPTIEVLVEMFCQIADAMRCLADNQIVHGDLACRNVLVFRISSDRPSEILVKLTDFGLTRTGELFKMIESNPKVTSTLIPVHHAAPEIIAEPFSNNYSEKSDVYSFGMLMWEACSRGILPFSDLKSLKEVCDAKRQSRTLERPTICSDELWFIIEKCLQNQPEQRPNFTSIRDFLFELKFHYKNDVVTDSMMRRSSSTKQMYENSCDDDFDSDDELIDSGCENTYANLFDDRSNNYVNLNSKGSDESSFDCFKTCKYCFEKFDLDDAEKHAIHCRTRSFVVSVIKRIVQLPPLQLTSCEICDELIPMSLFSIHQNFCRQILRNPNPQNSIQSLGTYLRPVSIPPPYAEIDERFSSGSNQRKNISYPTDTSNSTKFTSQENIDIPVMIPKPPKTGLNKKWSKLKKKFAP